jgi:hypothetical protein
MSTNVRYIDEPPTTRPISATINEAKAEFKQFAETRLAMLQAEMKEKATTLKESVPMLALGALMGATAFLVLTGSLICLLRLAFADSPFGWFLSFVIVGVVYAVIGGGALLFGYQNIKKAGLVPERTVKVLREDRVWLQNEAREQL